MARVLTTETPEKRRIPDVVSTSPCPPLLRASWGCLWRALRLRGWGWGPGLLAPAPSSPAGEAAAAAEPLALELALAPKPGELAGDETLGLSWPPGCCVGGRAGEGPHSSPPRAMASPGSHGSNSARTEGAGCPQTSVWKGQLPRRLTYGAGAWWGKASWTKGG